MSKRSFDEDSSPNIVRVPTVACIGEDVPDPPPKKPKLAELSQPTVPGEIKVKLDTISVHPPPLPKVPPKVSATVVESANLIKSEALSVIIKKKAVEPKCETNVKEKVVEKSPEEVKELKSTSKQPSWASNYLMSIGRAYKKPTKQLKLSTSRNKLDVASEELYKSKSTDDTPEGLKNEKLNKCPSVSTANETHVLITNPPTYEAMPNSQIDLHPYFDNNHSEILNINKITFDSNINKSSSESPANKTVSIINHSNNDTMRYPEINPQPYFDNNHPEMLVTNETPIYLNYSPTFNREEYLYSRRNSITENNWSREATFYRHTDDRSYLDKVEQFLSKISREKPRNYDCEPKSELVTKTQKKSVSLTHRDVTAAENSQKLRSKTRIDDKIFQTQSRDDSRKRVVGINKKKYDSEECCRYKSESTERHKERPSTSKKKYDCKENKKYEYKDAAEDFRRRESHLNRERPSGHVPRSSLSKTRDSSDSSSSEFIRNQSYQDNQNQCKNKTRTKRKRSSSCSSSENDRGRSSRQTSKTTQNKKNTKRDCRDSSNSSNFSMPCCSRKIQCDNERRSRRNKSNSSSNSEICGRVSPQNVKKSKKTLESCRGGSPKDAQKDKKDKSSRDRSNSNRSNNCEATLPCYTKKSKDNIKQKSRRERSNSSSNSESCANKLPCHAHRIHEKKKRKISNSSNSENGSSLRAHKHKEKPYNRNKNSPKSKSSDGNKSRKVINDVICKDRIKLNSRKDKYAELKLTAKQKPNSQLPPTTHSSKEISDVKYNKTDDSASIKSVVQVNHQQKFRHNHNTHEIENFDLRSKLSRKGLSQYFSERCDKKINYDTENKTNPRENLFITIENQNEDKEKNINTAKDKLSETSKKNDDNLKTKKHKKMKLVINVIYDSSQSSDSDGVGGTTDKKVIKECKGVGPSVKKVIKESNLSNELSFLDDLNIDEIVNSLTRNKNESRSLKNTTDAAITIVSSSSPEIDTYDLVSENEHSDASTVHLEELRDETQDDDTCIVVNQCSRVSSSMVEKAVIGDVSNTNMTIKLEKEESSQKAMMCENEIKQEISYEDSNKVVGNNNKYISDNFPEVIIKEEPAYKDLNEESNVRSTKDNIIPVKDIKEEPADNVLNDGVMRIENQNNETECNLISTHEIKGKIGDDVQSEESKSFEYKNIETQRNLVYPYDFKELGDTKHNAVLVNEIKEPAVTSCSSFLDTPNYRCEFPLIPPDEIKEETPNRVANEKSMLNLKLEDGLKTNTKLNTDNNQELGSGINTIVKIKNEDAKKSKERHKYNLSTGVGDSRPQSSGALTKILEQSKASSYEQEAAKFSTKHTNCKAIVHSSMTISDIIDLTHEVHDIKEEPSSDTEKADESIVPVCLSIETPAPASLEKADESIIPIWSSINTPVPAGLHKANTEKIKSEESQNVEELQSNSIQIYSNKELPNNTDFQIQKNTDLDTIDLQNQILIKATDNDVPVPSKVSENITTFEDPPDTKLKFFEDTEPKNEVSEVVKNSNSQYHKDGDNDSSKLQIKSGDANINKNTNNDSLPNKNTALDSERELLIHLAQLKAPTSNVFEKNNTVPETERDTAIQSHSHRPTCVETKTSSIKAESPKRSLELELRSEEKTTIQQLQDRLSNYLHEPYTVDSLLHRGMFSSIFQCKDAKGQKYVVKMLRSVKGCHIGIDKEKFMNSLQKDIPDENLNFVRFINGLKVSGKWCFLMEYFPKNLSQVLEENNKPLHINTVQLLSKQLVAAVTILRHQNVVHSDIKPGHILLNCANDRLKLCGFDCTYYVSKPNKLPNKGTVNYRAPETILGHSAGFSVDVWSTALVMFEMATRRQLFPGSYNNDILFKQMCTRGYVPHDMIRQSRFAHKHFHGLLFKRQGGHNGQGTVFMSEHQIYRNNILQSSIRSTYYKEWGKNICKKQKGKEMDLIGDFGQLLGAMLTIHPNQRLPIESVYAHPFLLRI